MLKGRISTRWEESHAKHNTRTYKTIVESGKNNMENKKQEQTWDKLLREKEEAEKET